MSRQQVAQHYARILARWPIDRLRDPERSFQTVVLRKRVNAAPLGSGSTAAEDESKQVNAAYMLLDNTFARQFPLPPAILAPQSNPEHYINLQKQLSEIPDRTWFETFMVRMRGLIRFR